MDPGAQRFEEKRKFKRFKSKVGGFAAFIRPDEFINTGQIHLTVTPTCRMWQRNPFRFGYYCPTPRTGMDGKQLPSPWPYPNTRDWPEALTTFCDTSRNGTLQVEVFL